MKARARIAALLLASTVLLCASPLGCDDTGGTLVVEHPGAPGTVTAYPETCAERACRLEDRDCGSVHEDCDGDGAPEEVACGACSEPEACAGSGVTGRCGDACRSAFNAECSAAGLPDAWGFPAGCGRTYRYEDDGELAECLGCGEDPGCAPLALPGGMSALCCP